MSNRRLSLAVVVAGATIVLGPPAAAAAAAGDVDTTYGFGGQSVTHVAETEFFQNGDVDATAGDALLQPDGKLVMVGAAPRDSDGGGTVQAPHGVVVVRLNPDGSRDRTFNDDGVLYAPIGTDSGATGVTLSGGKLYVTGFVRSSGTPATGQADVFVARITADGNLDPSFGTGNGFVQKAIDVNNTFTQPLSIDTAPDGSLVVLVNDVKGALSSDGVGVWRLAADGTPVAGFGTSGLVVVAANSGESHPARGAVVLANGDVLFAGTTFTGGTTEAFTMRLTATGAADATYGTSGFSLLPTVLTTGASGKTATESAFIQDAEGRSVLLGSIFQGNGLGSRIVVARALAGGAPDTSFGTAGAVTLTPSVFSGTSIAEQPDGKLAFGVSGTQDGAAAMLTGRLTGGGAPDPTFAGDGLASYDPTGDTSAGAVLVLADSSVIATGAVQDAGSDDGLLAVRYEGDTSSPIGSSGTPGPPGAAGAPGAAGPGGANGTNGVNGAAGPAGPAGKVELVTCTTKTTTRTVKHHKRKKKVTTCTTKLVSGPVKFTKARSASLVRGHVVYATGTAGTVAGHTTLALTARRRLTAGAYTLRLTSHSGRRETTTRQQVAVR